MATTTISPNTTRPGTSNDRNWEARKKNWIYLGVALAVVLGIAAIYAMRTQNEMQPVAPTTIAEPNTQNIPPGSTMERTTESTTTTNPGK